jgi:hypothetical protein
MAELTQVEKDLGGQLRLFMARKLSVEQLAVWIQQHEADLAGLPDDRFQVVDQVQRVLNAVGRKEIAEVEAPHRLVALHQFEEMFWS